MEGPPKLIDELWPGIPTPIDAAVVYDGTYTVTVLLLLHLGLAIHKHYT